MWIYHSVASMARLARPSRDLRCRRFSTLALVFSSCSTTVTNTSSRPLESTKSSSRSANIRYSYHDEAFTRSLSFQARPSSGSSFHTLSTLPVCSRHHPLPEPTISLAPLASNLRLPSISPIPSSLVHHLPSFLPSLSLFKLCTTPIKGPTRNVSSLL